MSLPPAPHDGTTGNLLTRAEPKVKAASIAALLTPLASFYAYKYVPGIAALPHELDVLVATLLTAVCVFAAGFAARAVDRIDLVFAPLAAKAEKAADRTIGARATDELETWAKGIAAPVKTAVVDAVHAVERAAGAGEDPIQAATSALPAVESSLEQAVAAGRAEAATVLAPAITEAVAEAPTVLAQAATPAGSAAELEALFRQMLARLDDTDGPATAEIPVIPAQAPPAPATQPGLTAANPTA